MSEIKGLVSITIPFYNSERFLSETIESVLAQTYSHWELFLVDDGSADRSTEIARRYAAQLPEKIRCLKHPERQNCGVTRTRNLGARNSQGEFLAFLDSDDVWLPHKLQQQVALMDANPEAGLVCGPSEYWYDWDANRNAHVKNYTPPIASGERLYTPPALLISSHPLGAGGAPCPSSFLLRRYAFERVEGFVESFNRNTYQLYEDAAFLAKIYINVPVFVTDCCSDRYRCHPLSIWQRTQGTIREESERRHYFRWLRQYLRERRIINQDISKVLRKAGWMYWLPIPASATRLLRRIGNRLFS